ncbi:hypothetical protein ACHAWF_006761 [Thalassiosira exigua]
MASPGAGETVHVSLGDAANHVTSHLLNLQGLAATASPSDSDNDGRGGWGDDAPRSLCDPSVTHDVAPLASDDAYASYAMDSGGRSAPPTSHLYVPRTLVVDGRDAFGPAWGGVARNAPVEARSQNDPDVHVTTWGGAVTIVDPSDRAFFGERGLQELRQQPQLQEQQQQQQRHSGQEDDPLVRFRAAATSKGLSPLHTRFSAPTPHSSYIAGGNSRHMQWDDEDEEEEEDYCYGQDRERIAEEKRRRTERLDRQRSEQRRGWDEGMEDAWEEAFYGGGSRGRGGIGGGSGARDDRMDGGAGAANNATNDTTTSSQHGRNNGTRGDNSNAPAEEREIRWHDYWMPPRPSPERYRVALPFDTSASASYTNGLGNGSDAWSTSFRMGYSPGSGGTFGGLNESAGITRDWREDVLSESLRKKLESCDVVKGFNVFVDGGRHSGISGNDSSTNGNTNKHTKCLSQIVAGGGFHAGLAASLLEELSEECRSAGRWAALVDPPSSPAGSDTEINRANEFRRRLNAGLALHGLSVNSGAFLPLSIEGAYRTLRGGDVEDTSPNRVLFEGAAAASLALEASTLPYRLRRTPPGSGSSTGSRRSRVGIQSGFFRGYGGGVDGSDGSGNEPYATAPSLTYHEFLACARPSSDRRRSIQELDARLRPLSWPSAGGGGTTLNAGGGLDVATLLSGQGRAGGDAAAVLASLAAAGLISSTGNSIGELQTRLMRGTSAERMRAEQQRHGYRSSRGSSASSRPAEPGEWLEDASLKTLCGGGGLLSSLSGNSVPFGRRADHHHFALSSSLRPSASDARSFDDARVHPGGCGASAFLRPMMEGMGVRYRPDVSSGAVVRDTVADLTGVGSYWRSIFADRSAVSGSSEKGNLSPRDVASHTPIVSVLGNSTRSYPRLHSVSAGFVDALHSRRNMGYLSRDVMAGIVPEKDDCEEALEYCRELVDVYEPPTGSGLIVGEDENDALDAYFDEDDS